MAEAVIGIIGGSGLYEIAGLEGAEWVPVESPWGEPSDAILTGSFGGVRLCFLPRHGRGHVQSPGSINYRANIDAMKRMGVTDILSFSACGSFREEMAPGDFVIVDQFIDRTFDRRKSFFGEGCVAHVSIAEPVCGRLGSALLAAEGREGVPRLHRGGTYLAMEGPQFSTRAESNLYRSWGVSVIGMTNMPEAKLAREAEANGVETRPAGEAVEQAHAIEHECGCHAAVDEIHARRGNDNEPSRNSNTHFRAHDILLDVSRPSRAIRLVPAAIS